jgi:hypothetical protein
VCLDTANYPGILLATTSAFKPWPFDGLTEVRRNTLTRAGGQHYGYGHGALKMFADDSPIRNVQISDILIEDATYYGLHFEGTQAISDISLERVQIDGYGSAGIWVSGNASGRAQAVDLVVGGAPNEGLQNDAPQAFSFERGAGNIGW